MDHPDRSTKAGGTKRRLVGVGRGAFACGCFGACKKGRHDPWLTRRRDDFSYLPEAAAFRAFCRAWPEPHMWAPFLPRMWQFQL